MHMQFRQWLAHAFAAAGSYALLPDWIRCDWCRRKITAAADAGIDYQDMLGVEDGRLDG
jgi:hypothetical protein